MQPAPPVTRTLRMGSLAFLQAATRESDCLFLLLCAEELQAGSVGGAMQIFCSISRRSHTRASKNLLLNESRVAHTRKQNAPRPIRTECPLAAAGDPDVGARSPRRPHKWIACRLGPLQSRRTRGWELARACDQCHATSDRNRDLR